MKNSLFFYIFLSIIYYLLLLVLLYIEIEIHIYAFFNLVIICDICEINIACNK